VHREVKQVRALAAALVQLDLTFPFSVYLSRAAAVAEVLVRDDTALGLDDLVAHPPPPQDVLRDARVGGDANDRPGPLHVAPHLLGRLLAHAHVAPSSFEPDLIVSRFSRTMTALL
jgi:hypothetical protein